MRGLCPERTVDLAERALPERISQLLLHRISVFGTLFENRSKTNISIEQLV